MSQVDNRNSSATKRARTDGMGNPESRSQFALRRSSRLLGTSNPESGSNLAGLRRSPRLHAKSAMTMSQSTQMASCKPCNPKPKPKRMRKRLSIRYVKCLGYFRQGMDMGKFSRSMRKADVSVFRCAYAYNRKTSDRWDNITEKRFIVVSGEEHDFTNVGRSHGIMWVGVHGIDSTCAVFLNKKPDMQRILDKLGSSFISYFRKYVLSEMEDIPDSPLYSREIAGKPFAVVSLPDFSNAGEESRHEASAVTIGAQGAAIKHLKEKVCPGSAFTKHEAEQIAISAFQHLCGRKFKADDIVVGILHEDDGDEYPWALTTSEIHGHLAAIDLENDK